MLTIISNFAKNFIIQFMAENQKPTGRRVGKSRVSKLGKKSGHRSDRHSDPEMRRRDRKFSAENFGKEKFVGADDKSTEQNSDSFKSKKPFRPKNNFKNKKKETQASLESKIETNGIRLNKFIANAGICSRRDADKHIVAGLVTVNGKVVDSMGYRVMAGDEVKFDNRSIQAEKKVYILLNKPKNYITTMEDTHGRRTVMDLVKNNGPRVYPVGRLDRNTTGLLLFTNDGEMTKRLTHPSHGVKKMYHVTLDSKLKQFHLDKILDGIHLEDGSVYVDSISYVNNAPKNEIGVEISSGRNRVVRRIFESLGYNVIKLDRVIFAGLTKKNIQRGKWRELTQEEVNFLKMV
jgi:23S rRNA pseudouridine2605 synthase